MNKDINISKKKSSVVGTVVSVYYKYGQYMIEEFTTEDELKKRLRKEIEEADWKGREATKNICKVEFEHLTIEELNVRIAKTRRVLKKIRLRDKPQPGLRTWLRCQIQDFVREKQARIRIEEIKNKPAINKLIDAALESGEYVISNQLGYGIVYISYLGENYGNITRKNKDSE